MNDEEEQGYFSDLLPCQRGVLGAAYSHFTLGTVEPWDCSIRLVQERSLFVANGTRSVQKATMKEKIKDRVSPSKGVIADVEAKHKFKKQIPRMKS